MALNNAALVSSASGPGWVVSFPYLSIHTTGTVTSSTNESTAPRVAANWSVSAAGVATATARAFTGGASGGPAVRVGYWSAATGGTYGGGSMFSTTGPVSDLTFNAAGAYTIDTITEGVTSA